MFDATYSAVVVDIFCSLLPSFVIGSRKASDDHLNTGGGVSNGVNPRVDGTVEVGAEVVLSSLD